MEQGKSQQGTLGFLTRVANSIENSSFGFYWSFVGIVIQFIHILLAIGGTFGVFQPDVPTPLLIGEWMLAVTFAAYFASTLFNFTLKGGMHAGRKPDGRASDYDKKLHNRKGVKYNIIVSVFAVFDIFVAFYFWIFIVYMGGAAEEISTQAILQAMSVNWFLTAFIISMTFMHPISLLFYAKEIDLSYWLNEENKS